MELSSRTVPTGTALVSGTIMVTIRKLELISPEQFHITFNPCNYHCSKYFYMEI